MEVQFLLMARGLIEEDIISNSNNNNQEMLILLILVLIYLWSSFLFPYFLISLLF
jgi:hypothetical protein